MGLHGDDRLFEEYWQTAIEIAHFPIDEMHGFILSMKSKNYPAVHHSPQYKRLYCPAYRVVDQAYCQETWFEHLKVWMEQNNT
jgi:hypothetical protein